MITAKPTEEREARLEGTVGSLDRLGFGGMYSGPLSDSVFFKVAFSSRVSGRHAL